MYERERGERGQDVWESCGRGRRKRERCIRREGERGREARGRGGREVRGRGGREADV